MPKTPKQQPPRFPVAGGQKPSFPAVKQQQPPRNSFTLGGRRFNGSAMRRGTRH